MWKQLGTSCTLTYRKNKRIRNTSIWLWRQQPCEGPCSLWLVGCFFDRQNHMSRPCLENKHAILHNEKTVEFLCNHFANDEHTKQPNMSARESQLVFWIGKSMSLGSYFTLHANLAIRKTVASGKWPAHCGNNKQDREQILIDVETFF